MDHITDLRQMLNMLPNPAFTVQEGKIQLINTQAQQLLLAEGTPIDQLTTQSACTDDQVLHTTLSVAGRSWGATVTSLSGCQLYSLEALSITPELQALSLMATQLRVSLGGLMMLTHQQPASRDDIAWDIHREFYRLLRMTNNVGTAERAALDDGSTHSDRNLCAIAEDVFEEVTELAKKVERELRWSVPEKSVFAAMDGDMIRHAMYALLDNAIKYSPKGSTLEAEVTATDTTARISVFNPGKAIPQDVRSTLFRRYTRPCGIEDGSNGLGLGLALVSLTATCHGGCVLVDSREGVGTRVTMTLAIRRKAPPSLDTFITPVIHSADHALVMLSTNMPSDLYKKL